MITSGESFGDEAFGNKLWQVVSHHIRVIDGKPATQDELNRTSTFEAVAVLLHRQLIERLEAKKAAGIQWTANERRAIKHLEAAANAFNAATVDQESAVNRENLSEFIRRVFLVYPAKKP